jgi:hypothetical protein
MGALGSQRPELLPRALEEAANAAQPGQAAGGSVWQRLTASQPPSAAVMENGGCCEEAAAAAGGGGGLGAAGGDGASSSDRGCSGPQPASSSFTFSFQ